MGADLGMLKYFPCFFCLDAKQKEEGTDIFITDNTAVLSGLQ